MRPVVYIDGQVGTVGLRIREWMAGREDVELLALPDALRKDDAARRERVQSAALAVLCLPDEAAREAAGWARESGTRVIDASTAHRVAEGWVFGLPELAPDQRDAIRDARCVANPGCYATAMILLLRPIVDAGLLSADSPVSVHALSGYTGGGRSMIERWEDPEVGLRSLPHEAPYALDRVHKHIPEVVRYGRLRRAPHFVPAVGPFRCGMRVEIPIHASLLPGGGSPARGGGTGQAGKAVWDALEQRYRGERFVSVLPIEEPLEADEWSFDPQACNDSNRIELRVVPHPSGHVLLVAVLDNLGKGACGVAIQCINLMLGIDETAGLPV